MGRPRPDRDAAERSTGETRLFVETTDGNSHSSDEADGGGLGGGDGKQPGTAGFQPASRPGRLWVCCLAGSRLNIVGLSG